MAMAFVDEEEVWRCPIHPSKRRRHGVCPLCLRDKLINLCQNCANVRPCDCPDPAEPTELKRSRSLAVSFLRSMSTHKQPQPQPSQPHSSLPPRSNQSSSFWSKLTNKPKKREKAESDADELSSSRRGRRSGITGGGEEMEKKKITMTMMMRSKSAGIGIFTNFGSSLREGGSTSEKASSKRWFLSPIKTLKQSMAAKVNNENSPLSRG